jgi:hypothetical protein
MLLGGGTNMNSKLMSKAQLNLIRSLFRDISPLMNDESREAFIESMNNNKDIMTTKDASELIDFMISIRTKANLAKAKAMRANKA